MWTLTEDTHPRDVGLNGDDEVCIWNVFTKDVEKKMVRCVRVYSGDVYWITLPKFE
jgi:hypothetical protein